MKKLIAIICLIGLINPSELYAEDSVFLKKDEKAPFEGFLLSEEKVRELRNTTIERDAYKSLNESYQKSTNFLKETLSIKDNQIQILLNQNDNLAKSLKEERSTSNLERIAWFALGVVGTGLAAYGIQKITQ